MAALKVIWSNNAKKQIKQIFDYLKYDKKTPQGAENVRRDILKAGENILFAEQYQKDEINSRYRRVIVRHYKLIYLEKDGTIIILRVFDTLQNPNRLLKENDDN